MSADTYIPRLCGGTYFVLLMEACDENASDPVVMEELMKVYRPGFKIKNYSTFRSYTSEYKNCKSAKNNSLKFKDTVCLNEFDKTVNDNYDIPLSRMTDLTINYIKEKERASWLVRALLELIKNDTSIDDNQPFYIYEDGTPISASNLGLVPEYYLPSFLLGIWHFAIMHRQDNTVGKDTVDKWYSKASTHASGVFVSSIGSASNNDVKVILARKKVDIEKAATKKLRKKLGSGLDELFATPISEISDNKEDPYYKNALRKYNKLKTLLYNDQPRRFYDFYVCNNLRRRIQSNSGYVVKTMATCNLYTLNNVSKYIMITGTGGLGKSMMMRHLLLDTIKNHTKTGVLPILMNLKNYQPSRRSLLKRIFEIYEDLDGNMDYSEFEDLFKVGKSFILFDGLDEIKAMYKDEFEKELEKLTDKYPLNTYIVSSRPISSFITLSKFTVLELAPFSKSQAEQLIEKLDFRSDDVSIKKRFQEELHSRLFETHRDFCENPLLLTIMLMTFEQFADIPSKMHVFYREAYITLSQKHDATKGAFQRSFKTASVLENMSAEVFEKLFAEFCALTYYDEKYEFSESELDSYFKRIKTVNNGSISSDAKAFMDDLTNNICMMYYEGGKYCFIHRSIQEYFCALFFSRQKDKNLPRIGEFFNTKGRIHKADKTFDMLYDMIPEKVEEYIFLDYLEKMFSVIGENNYWEFLKYQYSSISYTEGDVNGLFENTPRSFIYYKICTINDFLHFSMDSELPAYEEFRGREYYYVDSRWDEIEPLPDAEYLVSDDSQIVSEDEISSSYTDIFGEPTIAGWDLEFEVSEVLKDPDHYRDLIEALANPKFSLYEEFEDIKGYYRYLKSKQERENSTEDFFSQLS